MAANVLLYLALSRIESVLKRPQSLKDNEQLRETSPAQSISFEDAFAVE